MWTFRIVPNPRETVRYERRLSADEVRQASAFRFEADRHRYITAHGVLRSVLSRYLSLPPSALRFGRAPGGKPFLRHVPAGKLVQFNLAHTDEMVVLVIARTVEVGIDVERVREVRRRDAILARFLSPSQWREIQGLPPEGRTNAFFRWWTANEALLKARGKGLDALGEGMDFVPREEPASGFCHRSSGEGRWRVWSQAVAPDHLLAVAAHGEALSLHFRNCSGGMDVEKSKGEAGLTRTSRGAVAIELWRGPSNQHGPAPGFCV